MPDGVAALARLGIEIGPADSFPFAGIRFLDRGVTVAARFPTGPGLGVRRTTLHRILVEHAESLGVELHWATRVNPKSLRGDWIIGADGGNSAVRKWSRLEQGMRERRRFGFCRHYRLAPWTEFMEVYWGARCQVYITPVAPDSVCVVAISRDAHLRLDEALREFPQLARRLPANAIISSDRGAVSAGRELRTVASGRVALVGDASGSVDAITGEGLCLAFRHAIAVVDAIAAGDLAEYPYEHRKMARRPARMGKLLVALEDHLRVRRGAMVALAKRPQIFAKLLEIHVGAANEIDPFPDAAIDASVICAGDHTTI
ncbi:MAG TPA: FAD-dependent monooxygenase [Bryobacteraceae bacterium]|nr:FAD-dependent monooxygenase [Bryobacteraceae bacterium]